MIINKAALAALFTGFKTAFNNAFAGAESYWDQVAMLVQSSTSQEVYPWLGNVPNLREWVGERVVQNLATHDFTIKNKSFELTVGVGRDTIEDDTYGVYTPFIADMGRAAKVHPDQLVFALLKAAFTTKCYDGQNFFDTDHPVLDANGVVQSVSNCDLTADPGGAEPWFLLDTSRAVKPLIFQRRKDYKFVAKDQETDENVFWRKEFIYGVDGRANAGLGLWQLAFGSKNTLNEANYTAARAAMRALKGDGGRVLGVRPTLLVVPPSLETAARKLVVAETSANGATNVLAGTANVLVAEWLA